MAASIENVDIGRTPKKVYFYANNCIICGFRFVQTIKDSEGNEKSVKYFNKKLKMTKDRIELLEECLGTTILNEADTQHGVCVPCFRSVEKVHNLKENLNR